MINLYDMTGKLDAILGLDPGRDKIGFALVSATGDLYCSGIVMNEATGEGKRDFLDALEREVSVRDFAPWLIENRLTSASANNIACEREIENDVCVKIFAIALGNGTSGKALEKELRSRNLSCEIIVTNEHGTTLEARGLYWLLHRPSLLRKFLPRSLWGSPRPLDDLAAWAIARRCLRLNFNFS